jgi:hypothetical protein
MVLTLIIVSQSWTRNKEYAWIAIKEKGARKGGMETGVI